MVVSPTVSVIIPSFNRAYILSRTLESVFAQTYPHMEVILVDDGSTDKTEEVCQGFSKLQYFYQENSGVSMARNQGVRKSRGEYIAFLDSDDEWLPEKLQKQVEFLESHPEFSWVHGEEIWIRNGRRVNPMKKHQKGGGNQFFKSLNLCLISPSTVMMKRTLFDEFEGFDPEFTVCEDYDLWLRILSRYPVGFIDEYLIKKYGGHEDQLSKKYFAMDYFRVKTLEKLWRQNLRGKEREEVQKVGIKKSEILIQGYKKHGNFKNLSEVEKLLSVFKGNLEKN